MARSIPANTVVIEAGITELYDVHADFVWRSLHRLGVRSADLPDLLQEVFLVLHRRGELDPQRSPRGLLWTVAVGLARNYRRRAFRGQELLGGVPERSDGSNPEEALETTRGRERGQRLLAELDPEKRAVFMFEVEGLSGNDIATRLGLPLGTVHSRLHAARRELAIALKEDS